MEKRTSVAIESNTLERLRQCQTWQKETNDVLINKLIDGYVLAESKCQVCGKMCKQEILKKPLIEKDGFKEWVAWGHKEEQGHPPYPAMDWSKAEAEKDYKKFKKKYGQK
jgi:hypothetical protein